MFWKIYFWILSALIFFGALSTIDSSTSPFEYFDLIFCTIGLVSLFGYSYKKRILNISFWKFFAPVFLFWEIFFLIYENFIIGGSENIEHSFIFFMISLLITIPGYVAVFLYGYRSKEIWLLNRV